ncbi:WD repeat-containing protein 43-like [Stegodyphus dumicola]|uniref:WD repeat-containing protein 43-like n=1 Tax=Stegodyphus dumicola TaxID=202533 RepID=UPI0015B0AC5C|nr:WD repeat-containing protein 43-like [Stegodyphus dumicola]
MSFYRNLTNFSSDGQYFAYSSPDGCLKIWETSTNILKQEYTPSSHLSATCSSLSWGPCKQNAHLPKKSKKPKRNGVQSSLADLQLIAMGTLTGDILLYSFTNADLHSFLSNGHTSIVNDVCWYGATNSLFSCSNDQHIIIWDVITGKIKTKWKAGTTAVYSICVVDENNLLSSCSSIQWWNIKEKTIIMTFSGHATEVFRLLPVNNEEEPSKYFLSAAVGDRVISAWQLSTSNNRRAVASFVLSDEPENIDVICRKNMPLLMTVVSKDGLMHLFEHTLNGRMKKPLQPKCTVQIASKTDESLAKPCPVPILASNLNEDSNSCLLLYGNFLKPMFERIDISEFSKDLCLIRDISWSSAVTIEDGISRVKETVKPHDVKLLAPGHMTDIKPSQNIAKKRKLKENDITELPMEERLRALDLSKIPENLDEHEPAIKSDSMVHLLLQGLQSKDNNMLNSVLQSGDETVIHNTLKRLPLQSVLLVLKELHERLNKQEPRNHPCLKWLKGLLAVHLPYLMSCKDVDEYLGPISQLIEARVENFSKMSQLKGCLQILLSQAASCNTNNTDPSSEPLAIYQSESSDESENEIHTDESENEMEHSDQCSENEAALETSSEKSDSSDSESDIDT